MNRFVNLCTPLVWRRQLGSPGARRKVDSFVHRGRGPEIGGAWLVWQGVREHRGWAWMGLGAIALGAYGFVATLQPDAHFGRILAAYGGIFVAGSLLWGMALDGFRPDRWDVIGALVCLAGVGVIMYMPRGA